MSHSFTLAGFEWHTTWFKLFKLFFIVQVTKTTLYLARSYERPLIRCLSNVICSFGKMGFSAVDFSVSGLIEAKKKRLQVTCERRFTSICAHCKKNTKKPNNKKPFKVLDFSVLWQWAHHCLTEGRLNEHVMFVGRLILSQCRNSLLQGAHFIKCAQEKWH